MTDEGGQTLTFEHDAKGATIAFQSSGGISWRIAFDEQRRVHELIRSDSSFSFAYGSSGSVSRMVESFPDYDTEGPFFVREFSYDVAGRLVASSSYGGTMYTSVDYGGRFVNLSHSDGQRFEYGYSQRGNILYVGDVDNALISADYDDAGAPIALHSGADSVQFDRDTAGRVVSVRYTNGSINRYTYDALGNRRLVEYDSGASVRYLYDASGNIRKVGVHNRDGSSEQTLVEVGDLNRIERITYQNLNQSVDITYGSSGRATTFDFGSERAILKYNEQGVAQSFVLGSTGRVMEMEQGAEGANERDRAVFNSRLAVLDSHGSSQPNYGILTFDEITFDVGILDPLEIGVPKLPEAKNLLLVASTLFQGDTPSSMSLFEKPSNPVFQSNEYRSVNCCIPCLSCGCFDYTDCGCQPIDICPDLTNFQEVSHDSDNGVLTFHYSWASTTGDLEDISSCRIREFVIYHGSAPRFRFPNPPWNYSVPNPTSVTGSASYGRFVDDHFPGSFASNLANGSVTATQRYEYSCPCATNNQWMVLQNHRIYREVERKANGQYRYTITKAGRSATIDPIR
ncbi:MAG: hypothetical protein OXH52_14405 [Gammaproteobacteria bacterium]|nr:hypothetical protein [Gammaproteobacteria bacterium]